MFYIPHSQRRRREQSAGHRHRFIKGQIGSYPNYFFDVSSEDLADFLRLLSTFTGLAEDVAQLAKYCINRSDVRLWDTYDWFQKRFDEDEPIHGGLFDLNRYYYKGQ